MWKSLNDRWSEYAIQQASVETAEQCTKQPTRTDNVTRHDGVVLRSRMAASSSDQIEVLKPINYFKINNPAIQ